MKTRTDDHMDKTVWNEDDYEIMGWHDATVHAIAFERSEEQSTGNLLLDIDYIFRWVEPVPPSNLFSFWVSPCTLVFRQVSNFISTLRQPILNGFDNLAISDLLMHSKCNENDRVSYKWELITDWGTIQFESIGFTQTVRKPPKHSPGQCLSREERGGFSFSEVSE